MDTELKFTADVVEYDTYTGRLSVNGMKFPVALKNIEQSIGRIDEEDVISITFAFRTLTIRSRNP